MDLIHYTSRLIIRVLGAEWGNEVCSFYKKNQNFFEPFEPQRVPNFYTTPFHEATLRYEFQEFLNFRHIRFFLFEPIDPERIVGSICFSNIKRGAFQSCNLGYKMDFSCCNQGYMTEALTYCIDQIVFKEYNLHRIESTVLPTNFTSIRLMDRLDFHQEGLAKDFAFLQNEWKDHIKYARINSH